MIRDGRSAPIRPTMRAVEELTRSRGRGESGDSESDPRPSSGAVTLLTPAPYCRRVGQCAVFSGPVTVITAELEISPGGGTADTAALKAAAERHAGSSPAPGTRVTLGVSSDLH